MQILNDLEHVSDLERPENWNFRGKLLLLPQLVAGVAAFLSDRQATADDAADLVDSFPRSFLHLSGLDVDGYGIKMVGQTVGSPAQKNMYIKCVIVLQPCFACLKHD